MTTLSSCSVCGGTRGEPRARENGFTLLQCPCGAMFLDHAPEAGLVDPAYDPHPEDYYAIPAGRRLRFLAAHAPAGRLMEVGCGRGTFLRAAQDQGYSVTGIELDPDRAAEARLELGAPIETGPLEKSQTPDGSCDVVFHCDLLSHFPDPASALRRMRRMLAPDGVMVFEVGLVGAGPPAWYQGPLRLPHHRWFYDEASLEGLLARTGFRIERLKRFGLGPVTALSRLAGALRLGGGATRPKIFDLESGRHLELIGGKLVLEVRRRGAAARLRAHLYNAARYRIGALTPRLGPGTAFVAARLA